MKRVEINWRDIAENGEPCGIANDYFVNEGMSKHTCCICGCEFYDWTGNNPDPVIDIKKYPDAVCCSSCNERFVIPAIEVQASGLPLHD